MLAETLARLEDGCGAVVTSAGMAAVDPARPMQAPAIRSVSTDKHRRPRAGR